MVNHYHKYAQGMIHVEKPLTIVLKIFCETRGIRKKSFTKPEKSQQLQKKNETPKTKN